jgi:uncharacterized protein (DUF1778 family)
MAADARTEARVDFRLSRRAKATIEEAAALAGQSLSEFAVATLLDKAHQVLEASRVRALSERDARAFLQVLARGRPNKSLREAADWYKKHHADAVDD